MTDQDDSTEKVYVFCNELSEELKNEIPSDSYILIIFGHQLFNPKETRDNLNKIIRTLLLLPLPNRCFCDAGEDRVEISVINRKRLSGKKIIGIIKSDPAILVLNRNKNNAKIVPVAKCSYCGKPTSRFKYINKKHTACCGDFRRTENEDDWKRCKYCNVEEDDYMPGCDNCQNSGWIYIGDKH